LLAVALLVEKPDTAHPPGSIRFSESTNDKADGEPSALRCWQYAALRRRYLRLTESPCHQIAQELGNPRSARTPLIGRPAPAEQVFNRYRESRRRRSGRPLAGQALDIESEIRWRKSETDDFRRKRELVATADQVAMGIATHERLPLFVEAQVNRVRGLHGVTSVGHDVRSLSPVWKTAAADYNVMTESNLRASNIFPLSSDGLPIYAEQHR
jgi:hypothetical protein